MRTENRRRRKRTSQVFATVALHVLHEQPRRSPPSVVLNLEGVVKQHQRGVAYYARSGGRPLLLPERGGGGGVSNRKLWGGPVVGRLTTVASILANATVPFPACCAASVEAAFSNSGNRLLQCLHHWAHGFLRYERIWSTARWSRTGA